jgi:hypothetical protein
VGTQIPPFLVFAGQHMRQELYFVKMVSSSLKYESTTSYEVDLARDKAKARGLWVFNSGHLSMKFLNHCSDKGLPSLPLKYVQILKNIIQI